MKAKPTATSPDRQLVRFSQWSGSKVHPNRTEVYSVRQWDNGDLELDVIDAAADEHRFYNDESWVEHLLHVLDIDDAKAKLTCWWSADLLM